MLRWLYKLSVVCFFTTIAILTIANIVYVIVGYERMTTLENLPFIVRLPFGVLGAYSAFGIITLWLGMMWDCIFTSRLPIWSRVKWLILIIATNMLGALIYYYRVFKHRPSLPTSKASGQPALG